MRNKNGINSYATSYIFLYNASVRAPPRHSIPGTAIKTDFQSALRAYAN